jgi:hypothetical protein
MSLLGKILLVLNLLLGGAFAYLAVQDWQGRQTITAAGLRHLILLQGLPLGGQPGDADTMPADAEAEVPFALEGPGGVPTRTVSPELLKAYFAGAGGGAAPADGQLVLASTTPVPNQLAEVKRVYGLVKGYVDGKTGAEKAQAAADLLLLQAETYDDRAAIQALAATPDGGDELARRLYLRFDQVLTPPRIPDTSALAPPEDDEPPAAAAERLGKAAEIRAGGVKDEAERRARLAHLLVHLDRSQPWQKRVMMVVGVRRYVGAVGEQVLRFSDMIVRARRLIEVDQENFASEYARLRGVAIQRTQLARDQRELRARLEEEVRKETDFVKRRESEIMELKTHLAKVKADVDDLLARQTTVEQQLFLVQREVGQTLEQIYVMERELARRERQVYEAAK